jgi:hypothetical protein
MTRPPPTPGVFWQKSVELIENKRVDFFVVQESAQESEKEGDRG